MDAAKRMWLDTPTIGQFRNLAFLACEQHTGIASPAPHGVELRYFIVHWQ